MMAIPVLLCNTEYVEPLDFVQPLRARHSVACLELPGTRHEAVLTDSSKSHGLGLFRGKTVPLATHQIGWRAHKIDMEKHWPWLLSWLFTDVGFPIPWVKLLLLHSALHLLE